MLSPECAHSEVTGKCAGKRGGLISQWGLVFSTFCVYRAPKMSRQKGRKFLSSSRCYAFLTLTKISTFHYLCLSLISSFWSRGSIKWLIWEILWFCSQQLIAQVTLRGVIGIMANLFSWGVLRTWVQKKGSSSTKDALDYIVDSIVRFIEIIFYIHIMVLNWILSDWRLAERQF